MGSEDSPGLLVGRLEEKLLALNFFFAFVEDGPCWSSQCPLWLLTSPTMSEYAFKDAKHHPLTDDYDVGRQLGTYGLNISCMTPSDGCVTQQVVWIAILRSKMRCWYLRPSHFVENTAMHLHQGETTATLFQLTERAGKSCLLASMPPSPTVSTFLDLYR